MGSNHSHLHNTEEEFQNDESNTYKKLEAQEDLQTSQFESFKVINPELITEAELMQSDPHTEPCRKSAVGLTNLGTEMINHRKGYNRMLVSVDMPETAPDVRTRKLKRCYPFSPWILFKKLRICSRHADIMEQDHLNLWNYDSPMNVNQVPVNGNRRAVELRPRPDVNQQNLLPSYPSGSPRYNTGAGQDPQGHYLESINQLSELKSQLSTISNLISSDGYALNNGIGHHTTCLNQSVQTDFPHTNQQMERELQLIKEQLGEMTRIVQAKDNLLRQTEQENSRLHDAVRNLQQTIRVSSAPDNNHMGINNGMVDIANEHYNINNRGSLPSPQVQSRSRTPQHQHMSGDFDGYSPVDRPKTSTPIQSTYHVSQPYTIPTGTAFHGFP